MMRRPDISMSLNRVLSSSMLQFKITLATWGGVVPPPKLITYFTLHEVRHSPSFHFYGTPIAFYHRSCNFQSGWHSLPSSLARPTPLMFRQKPFTPSSSTLTTSVPFPPKCSKPSTTLYFPTFPRSTLPKFSSSSGSKFNHGTLPALLCMKLGRLY